MPEIEWLLFIAQLPAAPSSLRVNVWRRLRNAGAASLQNGVWILPRNEENIMFTERLLGYIRENSANGQVFLVRELSQSTHEDILARFQSDRAQEYQEFLEQSDEFTSEIERETKSGKFTFAELEESEQGFQRLTIWLEKIQKRDFIGGEKAQLAIETLEKCRKALEAFSAEVYNLYTFHSSPHTDFDDH